MPFDAHHAAQKLQGDERLADLGLPQRVWAVGPVYGRYGALCQLHEVLARRLKPRDRLVYTGNYLGSHGVWTGEGVAVIDELLAFRNAFIAISGFFAEDVVFLKGQREDLVGQLIRLAFQKNPAHWLDDAMQKGLEGYVAAYGGLDALYANINNGIIALNRWAHGFQTGIAHQAGHTEFFAHLRSCAVTHYSHTQEQVAVVPFGLDPNLPINLQYDELVWPSADIGHLQKASGYTRIVRGQSATVAKTPLTRETRDFVLDLDTGDTLDGRLYAACLDPQGQLLDMLSF
jgi:serine/threonine protein phosphatase 1